MAGAAAGSRPARGGPGGGSRAAVRIRPGPPRAPLFRELPGSDVTPFTCGRGCAAMPI